MAPRPILKGLPNLSTFSSSSFSSSDNVSSSSTIFSPNGTSNAFPFASSSSIPPLESPHVHFPPTPILTRIVLTHSPFSYDRRSIIVTPNTCELPRRGEREIQEDYFQPHMYHSPCSTRSSSPFAQISGSGNSVRRSKSSDGTTMGHRRTRSQTISLPYSPGQFPSGFTAQQPSDSYPNNHQPSPKDVAAVPPLVLDLSSDPSSSESDAACGTPPEAEAHTGDTSYANAVPTTRKVVISGLPHISMYFPGGLSLLPGEVSSLEHGQLGDVSLKTRVRKPPVRSQTLDCIHSLSGDEHEFERLNETNDNVTNEYLSLNNQVSPSGSTRFRNALATETNRRPCQNALSNGFHESGLDGCLGGF